jgi:Na+/proline symporter
MGRPHEVLEQHATNAATITTAAIAWVKADRFGKDGNLMEAERTLTTALAEDIRLREAYRAEVKAVLPDAEANDKDYIFITFIMDHMPIGIIGLLLAMIFSAGMSSTSAELSALATTSVVDVVKKERTDGEQVRATKWATVGFGLLALAFAALFSLFENLIQAVNIIGSLFYGTILGIFLVAFFLKRVGGTAVFIAALVAQAIILYIHFSEIQIAFLWYNLIAPAIVVVLAVVLEAVGIGQQAGSRPS